MIIDEGSLTNITYKTILEIGIYVEAITNVYNKVTSQENRAAYYEAVEDFGVQQLENISRFTRAITARQPKRTYNRCLKTIFCPYRCCNRSINTFHKALR